MLKIMFTLEDIKRFIDKDDWDTINLYENLENKDVECFYICPSQIGIK